MSFFMLIDYILLLIAIIEIATILTIEAIKQYKFNKR